MKKILALLSLCLVIGACEKNEGSSACIDPSLINPAIDCADHDNPVCGCDGKTYGNSCIAEYVAGVPSFTEGACRGFRR